MTEANEGVALRYVGHATMLVEVDGVRILTDPFLRDRLGPLERHGPTPVAAELGRVDVVLVSHGHPDHLDRRSLLAIEGNPVVVVPGKARRRGPALAWVRGCRASSRGTPCGTGHSGRGGPGEALDRARRPTRAANRLPRRRSVSGVVRGRHSSLSGDGRAARPGGCGAAARMDMGTAYRPGPPRTEEAADVAGVVGARIAVPIHWGTLYPR